MILLKSYDLKDWKDIFLKDHFFMLIPQENWVKGKILEGISGFCQI